MKSTILETAQSTIKYWWLMVLLGVLFSMSGFWILSSPLDSFVTLSVLFGVLMFVSGTLELIYVLSNRQRIDNWGWQLTSALFDFLIGVILISYPAITMHVLALIVAFYFIFKGFGEISLSIDMKGQGLNGWGVLLFFGLIAVVLGIIIIFRPMIGGITIVFYTGFAFMMIGVFKIVLGLKMRKIKSTVGRVHRRLEEHMSA